MFRFIPNWSNHVFILLGGITFSILFGCTLWLLHIVKNNSRENVQAELITIQNAAHQAMHYWRELNIEAAVGAANRSVIKQQVAELIKSPADPVLLRKNRALAILRQELAPFIKQHHYEGFYVVPKDNINYGALHDSNLGQKNLLLSQQREKLLQAFAGETTISNPITADVPLIDEYGTPRQSQLNLFVITPVTGRQGKPIALLMFRIALDSQFNKILSIGRFGNSGETYAFNKQGLLLSPSRFEVELMQAGLIRPDSSSASQLTLRDPGGNLSRGHRPGSEYANRPHIELVANTLKNHFYMNLEPMRDYRGVKTVGVGLWDEHEGLGFITQLDYTEAFGSFYTIRNVLFLVTGIASLLLLALIVSLINSRQSALRLAQKRTEQLKQQNQSLLLEIDERKQVEQTLQNTQTRTNAILQSAFDAIIATDQYGLIEQVNPAALSLFDYKADEMLGRNIKILMPEAVASKHDHLIRQHNAGEMSTIVGRRREMVAKRSDGSTFPIELAVEETIIEGEKYFTSTITDMTERKAMMERVSTSERDYKMIINNLSDTFYRTDQAGKIIMVSPAAEQLLGYRQEELLGAKLADFYLDPHGRDKFLQTLLENDGVVTEYEAQLQRKDGIVIWVSTNAHFYIDDYGNPLGVEGTSRDITMRKLAEEELRESRQRLSFHIKQTPLGVIEWDIDFKVIEWNPAAESIFGYSRNEAIGRHATDLVIPPEYTRYVDDIWYALIGQRGGQQSTNQNMNKAGELIWCEWYNTPLVNENMDVIGVASMVMDVTPRKKAEEVLTRDHEQLQQLIEARTDELNVARIEAERANEAKSEFLANMSHELRTPIHTILSFAEMGMKKTDKLSKVKIIDYFSKIHRGGERQLQLLNNLLDLSKLESQNTVYEFAEHDIRQVLDEQLGQHEVLLHEKNLTTEIDPTPIDTHLYFDRVRIEQVIRNLLSNAIKFSTEGGSIRVKLSLGEIHLQKDSVPALIVTFSDSGIGIPPDELLSIFDKFIQSSKTRTKAGGTGLGLSICQEIITAHGGRIWAENNSNGGASFNFSLPLLIKRQAVIATQVREK